MPGAPSLRAGACRVEAGLQPLDREAGMTDAPVPLSAVQEGPRGSSGPDSDSPDSMLAASWCSGRYTVVG